MNLYVDFTTEAIKDLTAIASYTAETWGHEQAFRYAELLNERFLEVSFVSLPAFGVEVFRLRTPQVRPWLDICIHAGDTYAPSFPTSFYVILRPSFLGGSL